MAINVPLTNSNTQNMSRHDFIGWVNDVLSSDLVKIEELSTGAAYCQMVDILFPGSINLRKVKFEAKHEHEYIYNFKLFQTSLSRVNIEKNVPIERLIRARFQDNFEFLQWFKKFFDANYKERTYDPVSARFHIKLGSGKSRIKKTRSALCVGAKGDRGNFAETSFSNKTASFPANVRSEFGEDGIRKRTQKSPTETLMSLKKQIDTIGKQLKARDNSEELAATEKNNNRPKREMRRQLSISENRAPSPATINTLNEDVNKLRLEIVVAEKDRNFYYDKLQKVELLCKQEANTSNQANNNLVRNVVKILYMKHKSETSSTESSLSTLI